jgi:hypothetical protein
MTGHRIVRFRIIGVEGDGLAVVSLGILEFLHLQVEVGDALDAVDVLGIALQHRLVLVNRVLSHAIVVLRIDAGIYCWANAVAR